MSLSVTGKGYDLDYIVDNGPWSSIDKEETVVDIGGSHGKVIFVVAKKYTALSIAVEDLSSTVEALPPFPEGLKDRIIFLAHDFFTEQPNSTPMCIFLLDIS